MSENQPATETPESLAIMALVKEIKEIRQLLEDMADNLDEIRSSHQKLSTDFQEFSFHGFGF